MSGSIDANQIRTGNFLDALAHPTVVNPLAAYSSAADAAGKVWNIRKYQAEQAAGEAQQAGVDASGIYQPNTAASALKAAGPGAALAAGQMLESSQRLGTAQTAQGAAVGGILASELAPLINLPDDQLHDGVAAVAARIIARGVPAAQVLGGMARLSNDPATLRRQLELLRQGNLPPEMQQPNIYGQFGTQMSPSGNVIGTRQWPQTGAVTQAQTPQSGVPAGPSADTRLTQGVQPQETTIYLDANGREIPKGPDGLPLYPPAKTIQGVQPRGSIPGWMQAGMPPGSGPVDQAGRPLSSSLQNPNAPPGTPPGRNAPVTPPPAVTPVSPAGAAPQAATPAPAAPGAVAPPPAATPPAGTPGAAPGASAVPVERRPFVITAPPQGQPLEQEASQKQFIADRTAQPNRQTQDQNLGHAYDALKLITTGKSSENISQIRSQLAGLGLLPSTQINDEAAYEIFRKYTERTIADAGNAGGTDAARAVAAASNPGTPLIAPANLAFLRNDIGKNRQAMAPYMTAPDKTIGAGYGEHAANIASNTDYRGFNWDMYSPSEQKEILKSVGKPDSTPYKALARAIGMGHEFWPTKGATSVVPHAAATPQPSSNLLAMAGASPGNALAAA